MNYEDVQKVSNAAAGKAKLLESNFAKYFMRAVMAGFFIDVAMIFSNVVGNIFLSLCLHGENSLEPLCSHWQFF